MQCQRVCQKIASSSKITIFRETSQKIGAAGEDDCPLPSELPIPQQPDYDIPQHGKKAFWYSFVIFH